ncbi:hypothetical protein GF367_04930 [Candidatus Woesearchaeota archaeon]|nr:hypothetical protein [Candidatus Woesearchaeota archaeon]
MANKQLVDYIKEQLNHRMDSNSIRTVLIRQGWSAEDVEAAMYEAHNEAHAHNKRHYHTHFVGIAIASVVVIILFVALFLVVFRQTEPASAPSPTAQPPLPAVMPPPEHQLSGWAVCQAETDGVAKDACYQDLNRNTEHYDCDAIPDNVERGFCYRAKEAVLLQEYADQA